MAVTLAVLTLSHSFTIFVSVSVRVWVTSRVVTAIPGVLKMIVGSRVTVGMIVFVIVGETVLAFPLTVKGTPIPSVNVLI